MVLRRPVVAVPKLNEELTWITASRIERDEKINTRPVDYKWVSRKLPEFDPDALGVLYVALMDDGRYVVVDGQNRLELVRQAIGADQMVPCRIYVGLTVAQAAHLFGLFAAGRHLLPIHMFLARLTEGEPSATAIQTIIRRYGWRISDSSKDGNISAVAHLDRIYKGEGRRIGGVDGAYALDRTMASITSAWGHKRDAVHGEMLLGIGSLFLRYGTSIDHDALVKRLAGYQAGSTGILGDARGLRGFQGGKLSHCVAEIIVNAYNRKRRNQLPPWRAAS